MVLGKHWVIGYCALCEGILATPFMHLFNFRLKTKDIIETIKMASS